MADGLGVLLLTWNNAFYRFGSFAFDELEKCIFAGVFKIQAFIPVNLISFDWHC